MDYEHLEHVHRFALWTASSATRRAFTSSTAKSRAVNASGLRELVFGDRSSWPATPAEVDAAHRTWAHAMLTRFESDGVTTATYGRAAKLIAVYLKTAVVVPSPEHPFSALAHPPVDRVLLQALATDRSFKTSHRRLWRTATWTEFDEAHYFEVIESFRDEGLDRPAFWMIERYWDLTAD